MRDRKQNILKEAVVLLIVSAMVLSAIPAVTASENDESLLEINDVQLVTRERHDYSQPPNTCSPRPVQTPNMGGGFAVDAWLGYNDGFTENSLGLTSGGDITMAITLTDTELALYRGCDIDEIYASIGSDSYGFYVANYDIWIETSLPAYGDVYTGGVNVVHSGTSSGTGWDTIDIANYVIPPTGDVVIGFTFWGTIAGVYPCGMDESNTGPTPRANHITYNGFGSWGDLPGIGFAAVWGMDIGVTCGGGPSQCLPNQCDFELVSINNVLGGPINSLPQIINITIRNNGEVGISELKLLADVYEKICGPTTTLCCDKVYDLCDWEVDTAADWTVTDDGDGDSFVLQGGPDNRWLTNDQAWRNTMGEDRSFGGDEDVYLGLSPGAVGFDTLTWHCQDTNDISGAACATFTFSYWCEGEYGIDGSGNVIPVDYATLSFSLDDGMTWTDVPISDFVAYDTNDAWEEVTLKFLNENIFAGTSYADVCDDCEVGPNDISFLMPFPGVAKLQVKWVWQKDVCDQYEGLYIDATCLTRTEMYDLKLVHQTHDIIELDPCVGAPVNQFYEFPLGWDPEPDTWYQIDICGQVFDCPDCCELIFDNNCQSIQFYVTDIHDMRCENIELVTPPGPLFSEGDPVTVNMTVKNVGTFAEDNVPVDLKVGKSILDRAVDEDFESSPTDWDFYVFTGSDLQNHWRWTSGDATIDNIGPRSVLPGSEAMICAEPGFMYPNCPEGTGTGMADPNTYDLSDVESADLNFYARWSVPANEDVDGDGYIDTFWGVLVHPTSGPDSAYWWFAGGTAYFGFQNDWTYMSYDLKAEAESFAYDGGTIPDIEYLFGCFIGANDGNSVPVGNPIPWSGLMIDNVQFDIVSCGPTTVVDTQYTGALAPGDTQSIFLTWDSAEYCSWCLCGDIQLDGDVDTTNDECCLSINVRDTFMIHDFYSIDLTGGDDCLWHICRTRECGGTACAWAGIVEGNHGHYVNDMDDSLVSPPINLAGATPGAAVEFTTWYEFADAGDFGEVYARYDSASPWIKLTTGTIDNWVNVISELTGPSGGFVTAVFFIPGALCSANTQIKFRMVSDSSGYGEGWYVCDVTVYTDCDIQFNNVMFLNQPFDSNAGSIPYSNTWNNFETFDDFVVPGMLSKAGWYGIQPYLGDPNGWSWTVEFYPDSGGQPDTSNGEGAESRVCGGPGFSGTPTFIYLWGFYMIWHMEWDLAYQPTFGYGWFGQYEDDGWGEHAWVPAILGSGMNDHAWSYNFGSSWYERFFDMSLELYYFQPIIIIGPQVWFDDFDRLDIAPWQCVATKAGDYWDTQSQCIYGYPSAGKGLNNAMYTQLDFTDPALTYVELYFVMSWNMEAGVNAFIEISPDWDGASPMASATWIPYYEIFGPSVGGPISSQDLVMDDRFVLNEYLGDMVYLRFRYTTPGEGFPAIPGFWCIQDKQIIYKEEIITETDNEPPVTNIAFDSATGKVTLLAQDYPLLKGSGVKATYYKIDTGDFQTYSIPFSIPEGQHTVYYYSEDNAGNTESQKSATYTVDTTPPTVTITSPEAGKLYLFGSPIMDRILSDTTLCIGKVPIAATADDAGGSGIFKVLFSYDGSTGWDDTAPYEDTFRGMHFGPLTIKATALDKVGLESAEDSITVNVYSLGLF